MFERVVSDHLGYLTSIIPILFMPFMSFCCISVMGGRDCIGLWALFSSSLTLSLSHSQLYYV